MKQHLAALRMLFDWLVVGHVLDVNPALAVRGPKHVTKKGPTPVLDREETRALLAVIDDTALTGLRDRVPNGVMIYTFARVGAVLQMNVGDYFSQGRRGWLRFNEKGGKEHEAPASLNWKCSWMSISRQLALQRMWTGHYFAPQGARPVLHTA